MQGNRPLLVILAFVVLAAVVYMLAKSNLPGKLPTGVPSKIVVVNGYPEFHVDNKPFFMHSAAFYYYRVPRDRWEESLRALKAHGINTVDLYIIWNWHQPEEGVLDFDGRTLPGRDLKGLLKLISDMKFKLSVRPGPFICSEWKNGGYPDWLLSRPEYRMPLKDILEGRYPRLSALQYEFSERAAEGYLSNATHLAYTRKWYRDVMNLVRPYLSSFGGNVILLQIDDDQALDKFNYNGPKFWQYLKLLRAYLEEAAGDGSVPVYFNPADMRVTAASSAAELGKPFWAMGQYYQESGFGSDVLRAEDTSQAKYLTEILKTQPGFPAYFIEYQAGWFAGAEDVKARSTDPGNTLLSSRFLFQNGVKGLNYFPLQDTLFPEGHECAWSNYFYSWESALGLEGELRPRAEASIRNGALISGMGQMLAASHYAADIGIVHTIGTYPQEKLTRDDISGTAFRTMTATQYALFNQVSTDLMDLDYQSLTQLRRYPMILLPVASASGYKDGKIPEYLRFSDRARTLLAEYVREGGHVVAYPTPPPEMEDLFPVAESSLERPTASTIPVRIGDTTSAVPGGLHFYKGALNDPRVSPLATVSGDSSRILGYRHQVGNGWATVLGAEFDRWVPLRSASSDLDSSLPPQPSLTDDEKRAAGGILEALLRESGITRTVSLSGALLGIPAQQPYASLLLADARGESPASSAYGFLAITNFSATAFKVRPTVRDPRSRDQLSLPELEIAARDALMLPLRLRFNELGLTGFGSEDEIIYSTAEITAVRPLDGAFAVDLYSKAEASLRLRLGRSPSGALRIGTEVAESRYDASQKSLEVRIPAPRDAAGRQILTIPYASLKPQPLPPETSSEPKVTIQPTLRIPVRYDAAYDLSPATLVALTTGPIEFSFTHPADCKGKCTARVLAPDLTVSEVNAEKRPAFTIRAPSERTFIRNINWTLENGGRTHSGSGQVVFIPPNSAVVWERDVDRDGFADYILENPYLRVIIYPHAGARSFALIRKDTNASAFTSIGAMRDLFQVQMPDPPDQSQLPEWTRHGIPGMHNRHYRGRITQESGEYAEVHLSYDAPDVAPAGALLERTVRLAGSSRFVAVTYAISPRDRNGDQGYLNLNSVALGSMEDENATVLLGGKGSTMPLKKRTQGTIAGAAWIALASRDGKELFGISWNPGEFESVGYDRRDYSLMLQLQSPRWKAGAASHSYHIRYHYDSDSPEARQRLAARP